MVFRYVVTTFILGIREPILTYANATWYNGIGWARPGMWQCDGMLICIKENPEWEKT